MENIRMNLRLFDANTQVTTQQSLTEEMKTFYSDYLIDAAEPELVHDQFAQKHPIPANGGKTIQFRRFAPLGKALTALTEGVTPDGQSLSMTTVEAAVRQYGGYIQMSDLLLLTAIDNNLTMATKLLGAQAGRTLDTITREVLVGGDNVQYADESVSARYLLQGGNASAADNNYLTVDCIRRAVRALKNANCRRIDGAFPVIIHPDVAYDLMNDPKWLAPHQYVDTEHMYEGEIGKIEGCRFVESTEAKIFHAEDLASDSRTLLTNGAVSGKTTFSFDGGTVKSGALVGRQVLVGNVCVTVTANTASSMTVDAAVTAEDNAIIYPGEAGAQGRDVYVTLVLGADGYGTIAVWSTSSSSSAPPARATRSTSAPASAGRPRRLPCVSTTAPSAASRPAAPTPSKEIHPMPPARAAGGAPTTRRKQLWQPEKRPTAPPLRPG